MAHRRPNTVTAPTPIPKGVVFGIFLAVPSLMYVWVYFGHLWWAVAAGLVLVLGFGLTLLPRHLPRFSRGQQKVELYGGPLDGEHIDLSALSVERLSEGITLPVRGGGRCRYALDRSGVLRHVGDG